MPLQIIRNDITKVKADVIVNTANPKPIVGGGTDTAIYKAAGSSELLSERKQIGNIARGDIAVTKAYNLDAKYIIHAVGPVWEDGRSGEFKILEDCYRKSLEKAHELNCESIAFPLMASGSYGFPKDKALQIAMSEISTFLMRDDVEMLVYLVIFDDKAFRLSRSIFYQVESFITDEEVIRAHKEEYERGQRNRNRFAIESRPSVLDFSDECELPETYEKPTYKKAFDEDSFDKNLYMSDGKEENLFLNHLIKLLNDKNIDNVTAYKRSNITKGAFSKIMCADTKTPKKKAVLGLCIGLKLDYEEAKELLASADMAFNMYDKRDRLVLKCIEEKQYDIDKVNAMLFICNLTLLGS